MKVTIKPGKLNGTILAPPSKSYAHRMLIGAALSTGKSTLYGISGSEDMLATMDCIRSLSADIVYDAKEQMVDVWGIQTAKCENRPEEADAYQMPVFSCRESGSTLRFFLPIALAVCGGGTFTGAKRLMERGIGIYEELFCERGISLKKSADAITVKGRLPSGTYRVKGDVSSQFVTGLIFALSLLSEDSSVEVLPPVESRPYIDITLDVLKQFGVSVLEMRPNEFFIKGGQSFLPGSFQVEGDWSNAAFLFAFQTIGNDLKVEGVKKESVQGDKACLPFLAQLKKSKTDKETQEAEAMLKSVINLSETPDLGPVLFASAAALQGGFFTGTKRLRIKESDRAEAMAEELSKFGVRCLVLENEVQVLPSELKKPDVPLNGHNDHRIVMALSILCSITGGEIEGCEAVKKSWPDFFEVLNHHGICAEMTEET